MKIYTEATALWKQFETEPVDYLKANTRSTRDILDMVDYYSDSKHLSGDRDGLGRYKPFYNIVNFRVQVAKVATDLDIKDITITSDSPQHWVKSMLLQKESYEWMKRTNFSKSLNEQGLTRAKYGGLYVKKRMEDGELYVDTVKWGNFACDQSSPKGTKIERHYMTPVELMEKNGAWDNVREVIEESFKQFEEKYGNEERAAFSERIEILEIHGTFPKSYLKEAKGETVVEEDAWTFSKQVYFIPANLEDYVLFAEEETEDPYKYLAWEDVAKRMLGRGVVEESEEAQVWTNDIIINQKNATDLASRVVLKTNSKNLANNVLEVDNGKIFELNVNEDINAVQMTPSALGFLDSQLAQWEKQVNNATSVYESNTGEQTPSGTPYSQTALLNQMASKPYDYRREEHGIFLKEIWEDSVIPHLVKKLKSKHILASDFTEDELDQIDEDFANKEARKVTKDLLLQGTAPTPEALEQYKEEQKEELRKTGRKRFIQIPDKYFDDIEAKVSVVTTGEMQNKMAVLTSLSNMLQTVSSSYNPQTGTFGILDNPVLARIFGQAVEIASAGVSPVSLNLSNPKARTGTPIQPPTQTSAPVTEQPA